VVAFPYEKDDKENLVVLLELSDIEKVCLQLARFESFFGIVHVS